MKKVEAGPKPHFIISWLPESGFHSKKYFYSFTIEIFEWKPKLIIFFLFILDRLASIHFFIIFPIPKKMAAVFINTSYQWVPPVQ